MTTAPDPATVREIARSAFGYLPHDYVRARLVQAAIAEHGIDEHDVPTWSAYFDAAKADLAGAVASWPDEQPQDDGDVRAVRALTNAASRMLGMWAEADEVVRRELWTTLHDRADDVFDRYRERYAELDERFGGSEAR